MLGRRPTTPQAAETYARPVPTSQAIRKIILTLSLRLAQLPQGDINPGVIMLHDAVVTVGSGLADPLSKENRRRRSRSGITDLSRA